MPAQLLAVRARAEYESQHPDGEPWESLDPAVRALWCAYVQNGNSLPRR